MTKKINVKKGKKNIKKVRLSNKIFCEMIFSNKIIRCAAWKEEKKSWRNQMCHSRILNNRINNINYRVL